MNKCIIFFVFLLMQQFQSVAKITMPVVFSDRMVLQREMPVRIFGKASEGALVTVRFNGQQQTAVCQNGNWMATLRPMPAGGPYTLQITGDGDEISFTDIMLGEVWLAGGQSNMALSVSNCIDFEKYLPAEKNPDLRFIHIPVTEFGKINREGLEWKYFDKESVKKFSAVSFFFATELQKRLGVTVGIVGSYRGGTWNENWMTPESIKKEPELQYLFEDYEKEYAKFKDDAEYEEAYQKYLIDLKEWKAKGGWSYGHVPFAPVGPKAYQRPSGLYHTMIEPLQPYTIKGCIWYQGEGNSARYDEFKTLFPAFIKGWRKSWQYPDMPLYFVQLPGNGKGAKWPQFRQAQLECFKKIKHCGMVVSEGCGDETDLHPRVKKPIGDRLAIAISSEVYGQDHTPYGPIYRSVKYTNGKAKISFDYTGSGLVLHPGKSSPFEIAGADKVFVEAMVKIKGSELLLWNKGIDHPKYVRYAYSPNPEMILFNREGLPASPFTTE